MTVLRQILSRIWGMIISILGMNRRLFRRLMCWAGRSRKNSGTLLPLVREHIQADLDVPQAVPTSDFEELQSWDSWEPEAREQAMTQKVGYPAAQNGHLGYRHPSIPDPESDEEEPDFFSGMQPQIKRTKKIVIKKKSDNFVGDVSSRLAMSTDIPLQVGADLETWDDNEGAWAEESMEDLSEHAEAAMRERRYLERQQRQADHQRRKLEKEAMRSGQRQPANLSAVKLS